MQNYKENERKNTNLSKSSIDISMGPAPAVGESGRTSEEAKSAIEVAITI